MQEKNKINDDLLNWLNFIINPNDKASYNIEEDGELKMAYKILEKISRAEKLKRMRKLAAQIDRNSLMADNYRRGEARGRLKGRTEEKIEFAKKMLAKNMDIQTIIELTELTKEEIEKLK